MPFQGLHETIKSERWEIQVFGKECKGKSMLNSNYFARIFTLFATFVSLNMFQP